MYDHNRTGIDIPNEYSIIEDADNQLAQLHQIRGRVDEPTHAFAYFTFRRGKVLTEGPKRLSTIRDGINGQDSNARSEIRGAEISWETGHMMSVDMICISSLEEAVLEEKGKVEGTRRVLRRSDGFR